MNLLIRLDQTLFDTTSAFSLISKATDETRQLICLRINYDNIRY